MSYKNLEIWHLAKQLVIDIHKMTLSELPKFEMYEEGAQIRRSVKSIKSNIVEGYGRRKYHLEYIRYLIFSISSNDETIDHLEILWDTKSLRNRELFNDLQKRLNVLGKKLNRFIQTLEKSRINKNRQK